MRPQLPQCAVTSAGVAALINHPADDLAQEVMKEHGYSLSSHYAKQATQPILTDAELIITLDHTHTAWIVQRFPQLQGRTYKLGRWQGNADVPDPYRKSKAAFDQAFAQIFSFTQQWVEKIKAF